MSGRREHLQTARHRSAAATARQIAALGLLLSFWGSPATAQTAEGFVHYLAALGLHRQAVDELQRLDLQGQPHWHADGLGYGYGARLLQGGLAAQAAEVLAAASETDAAPQRAQSQQTLLALALARTGQTAQAVAILSRLETFGATPQRRAQALAIRCMVHLSAAEADMGTPCAQQLLGPAADVQAIADLNTDVESRAFWHGAASAILPGLGQALGGQWSDSGAAFLVNGGLGYATWSLAADALYLDATLLGIGLTVRYYVGNIQKGADAGRAAAQRRKLDGARRLADQLSGAATAPIAGPAPSQPPR
jgi:hypothetical protein